MNNKTIKSLLILIMVINIIVIVSSAFLTPLWAEFVKKIGGDLRTAGNAICLFSIVIGFATMLAGKLENKMKHESWFLLLSQCMLTLGYAAYFFVNSPFRLYLVQIWLGLSGALQAPALYTLYHRFIPEHHETTAWGIWTGAFNISIGAGALLSAYIAHSYGFNAMFIVLLLVALLGCYFSVWLIRKERQS